MAEAQAERHGLTRLLPMLWRITSREMKLRLLSLLLVMLLVALLEMAGLAGIQVYFQFISAGSLNEESLVVSLLPDLDRRDMLFALSLGLIALLLAKLLFALVANRMLARAVACNQVSLAMRLFRAYQFAPYVWYGTQNTAELQRNLMQDVSLVSFQIVLPLLHLLLNGVVSGALLIFVLATLPPILIAAIVVVVLLLWAISSVIQKALVEAGREAREATGDALRTSYEGLHAMTEARILGQSQAFVKRFGRSQDRVGWALQRRIVYTESLPVIMEGLLMITLIMLVSLLVVMSETLEQAFATSAVLAVAVLRLRQVLSKILSALNKIGTASSSLPPLVADLDLLENRGDAAQATASGAEGFELLRLEDVAFRFPDQAEDAVTGVSLELRRGEHCAIMGQTGAGKSTLLMLLLGLISPTRGHIRVDGTDLADVMGRWHGQLGYVPQTVFLIDESIAANVALGQNPDEWDEQRIGEALEQAQLMDFVNTLPDGIHTSVGERGSSLSGGQRQRVGLARALYRRPSVIILDEATSALDRTTQIKVMEMLAALPQNPTIISVTHHLEPLEHADRLILLEKGRISADASVEEVWPTAAFHRITRKGGTDPAA